MIRPLLLAAVFLLAAPLASPALSLVSAERVDARQGRDKALYVFTHRHIAAGRLAGGVPLACNMARRPDLPCIPSGAVADVLGMAGLDCGLVDLVVRCRRKIPSGWEPPARNTRLRRAG